MPARLDRAAAFDAFFLLNGVAMTSQTVGPAFVSADVTLVHKEFAERDLNAMARGDIDPARPAFDIAFDWALILLATSALFRFGAAVALPAFLVIANRQRALGNLLHEGGHRNLYRAPRCNDFVARVFLAPALLIDLERYRATHARHHAMLGMPAYDPDYIGPGMERFPDWWGTYCRLLFSWRSWLASLFGHVIDHHVSVMRRLMLLAWWIAVWGSLASIAGARYAEVFVVSWYLAKATGFHAITVLREMCDHYGLHPGGIYSFTRDIVVRRRWRWLVHPHNNGYHLTHHLMPSVPYYRLPAAWKAVSQLPSYRSRSIVCTAYLWGRGAVVRRLNNAGPDNAR
ncbi:MAG TPA: fatty acid desaturase [Trinickia sp.]|uniref:fatty acid desaturase family protein n=1 Tax=Trinickia sp. TaxID=2571163 RepID=UPI002F42B58D